MLLYVLVNIFMIGYRKNVYILLLVLLNLFFELIWYNNVLWLFFYKWYGYYIYRFEILIKKKNEINVFDRSIFLCCCLR